MMYDDLIKELRDLAAEMRQAENAMLLLEAADTIEELNIVLESYRNRMKLGSNWIPANEPPKEEGKYITVFADGFVGENYYMILTDDNIRPKVGKWYHNEMGGVAYYMPIPKLPTEI